MTSVPPLLEPPLPPPSSPKRPPLELPLPDPPLPPPSPFPPKWLPLALPPHPEAELKLDAVATAKRAVNKTDLERMEDPPEPQAW
jgi:hypothetical protein